MRLRTRLGLLAAPFAVFALTAGSSATSQPYQAPALPPMQFEGDSITVQGASNIDSAFGSAWDVAIHAIVGATFDSSQGDLSQAEADPPNVEVINLGTNDVICTAPDPSWPFKCPQSFDPVHTDQLIDQAAAAFPSSTCVVFVTINSHNPSWNPAGAATVDGHLRSVAGGHVEIADWDTAWDPSFFSSADSPHPDAAGQTALMGLISDAVAACPPAATATTAGPVTTDTAPVTTDTAPVTTDTAPVTTDTAPVTTDTDPVTTDTDPPSTEDPMGTS